MTIDLDPRARRMADRGAPRTRAKIAPTPIEIERRLGAGSPGHDRAAAELAGLYARHRKHPTVKLERARWARLLTTALGTGFVDADELFVEHTLLVVTAEIIAHAVAGLDPAAPGISAASLVTGELFASVQIHGVVEAGCFDWPMDVPGGDRFLQGLARGLSCFAWNDVDHDVLKVLYESVVSSERRRQLGEHYTPDWLADRVVRAAVDDPLHQRVLDPACGSGTFLFHAVRRYLDAARRAGRDDVSALDGVAEHVMGTDIHPVAVTFARVTYLLALGPGRLQAEGRPALSIPVYLGDTMQWGQEHSPVHPAWPPHPPPESRVDVLLGNPPWLSFRFMPDGMQAEFRRLCEERDLWRGASAATNHDLSTLFILRSMERYLREDGAFAFVMPWAVLRGRPHASFRKGRYPLVQSKDLTVAFGRPWDLHAVKPTFFPVPCCVLFGKRADDPVALPSATEAWSGRLPNPDMAWNRAKQHLRRAGGSVQEARDPPAGSGSPYAARFVQGATVVPRLLLVVAPRSPGPLGTGAGRVAIMSRRSANEKAPWKSLPSLEGNVDRQFVRSLHLGETILPYRPLEPRKAVIPWDGRRLLHGREQHLSQYPGFSDWWRRAEAIWEAHRTSERLSLIERLDYQRGLSGQLPTPDHRIVYGASGMYLAAAVVEGDAVVEHQLYWATVASLEEGRYLTAILNSSVVTERLRPLQARGEHNPRHYDKYVWHLPIPLHDPEDERHARLAKLAEQAEKIAAAVALPEGKRFELWRGLVRKAVAESDVGLRIEKEVASLLA
jgi:SAM-dependent methyltransferase